MESSSSTSHVRNITLAKEVREQIVGDAKRDIVGVLFTENAVSQTPADRKTVIKAAVMHAVPRFSSLTVTFNAIVNKDQLRTLSQALTNARGKIIDIARSGVPHAYNLYRPRHVQGQTPLEYRVHIATALVDAASGLAFMHTHHFDENNNLHIDSYFDNDFIKHVVVRFVWYYGNERFLGNSPLQSLVNVTAIAGAATHCVLLEQQMDRPSVDPFTGLVHYNKFIEIRKILNGLEGEDKLALETFLLDILDVGPSQIRSVAGDGDTL